MTATSDVRERANMHRWISLLNGYFYPYMAYHLGHERIVYPATDRALGAEQGRRLLEQLLPP